MSPAIARLLYGSWVNVESGQPLFPYPRRSAQKTSYRSDSSGAISLHIKCVSGKPCSNNTGIPDPDFLTNISATSVLTVVAWKLSNIAARRRGPRRGHYEPPGHLILSSRAAMMDRIPRIKINGMKTATSLSAPFSSISPCPPSQKYPASGKSARIDCIARPYAPRSPLASRRSEHKLSLRRFIGRQFALHWSSNMRACVTHPTCQADVHRRFDVLK